MESMAEERETIAMLSSDRTRLIDIDYSVVGSGGRDADIPSHCALQRQSHGAAVWSSSFSIQHRSPTVVIEASQSMFIHILQGPAFPLQGPLQWFAAVSSMGRDLRESGACKTGRKHGKHGR